MRVCDHVSFGGCVSVCLPRLCVCLAVRFSRCVAVRLSARVDMCACVCMRVRMGVSVCG